MVRGERHLTYLKSALASSDYTYRERRKGTKTNEDIGEQNLRRRERSGSSRTAGSILTSAQNLYQNQCSANRLH